MTMYVVLHVSFPFRKKGNARMRMQRIRPPFIQTHPCRPVSAKFACTGARQTKKCDRQRQAGETIL